MVKPKLILVDSMALIHRAFHAYPELSTSDGVLVNSVYGFGIMFMQILKMLKPDYLIFTSDLSEETFRKAKNSEYKANRAKMPDELRNQISIVMDFIEATGLPLYTKGGFEADDIIGSIATKYYKEFDVQIVTGDKDLLQLLNDHINVVLPGKTFSDMRKYSPKEFVERFGFEPEDYIYYKALVGDASDNIKGAKGIGEKSATDFIKKYHTLGGIYENIDEIKERYKKILEEYRSKVFENIELVTIRTDLVFNINKEKADLKNLTTTQLVEFLHKYEFNSLLNQLKKIVLPADVEEVILEKSPYKLHKLESDNTKDFPYFTYFIDQTTGQFFTDEKFIYFNDKGEFIESSKTPVKGVGFDVKKFLKLQVKESKNSDLFSSLNPDSKDNKFDLDDLQILAYCYNPGYKMDTVQNLYKSIFRHDITEHLDIHVGTKIVTDAKYYDVVAFIESYKKIKGEIEKKQIDLYKNVDLPIVPILAEMESKGIRVNSKYLKQLQTSFTKKIDEIKKKIFDSVGHEFNPNSTKELAHVLFEELNLPKVKKIKTGFSTNERTISKLLGVHPIIQLILDYREYAKLQSTYVIGLQKIIQEDRIYTDFRQTVVATGRLSSINPNLQNIPTRSEVGEKIRKAFIADEGFTLLSLDYSQIDLRAMAHISGDEALIEAFKKGRDIHTLTASLMFEIPEKEVSTDQRRIAKMINFGIIYGISGFGLSDRLEGVDPKKATEFIKKYFERYPKVKEYFDTTKEEVEKNGYVETMFGRKRFFNLEVGNYMVKQGLFREAINMPIQGLSADIMKLAMIAVQNLINEKYDGKVSILLQIHDELLLEIKDDKALITKFIKEASHEMDHVVDLKVPLEVNSKVGEDWGEMKAVSK